MIVTIILLHPYLHIVVNLKHHFDSKTSTPFSSNHKKAERQKGRESYMASHVLGDWVLLT